MMSALKGQCARACPLASSKPCDRFGQNSDFRGFISLESAEREGRAGVPAGLRNGPRRHYDTPHEIPSAAEVAHRTICPSVERLMHLLLFYTSGAAGVHPWNGHPMIDKAK
jgi:hypothetical protein